MSVPAGWEGGREGGRDALEVGARFMRISSFECFSFLGPRTGPVSTVW